jgi:hypothetical protein
MSTPRWGLGLATLNNTIYAVGGNNGNDLKSCEAYDPATNTWSGIADMSSARHDPGLTVLHGKIYAAGGNAGTTHFKSGEAYDPATNTWSGIADMSTVRVGLGLAALNGTIYAAGGNDGSSDGDFKSAEALTPLPPTPPTPPPPTPPPTPAAAGGCVGKSVKLAPKQCAAFQAMYDSTGGLKWSSYVIGKACPRDDPCSCCQGGFNGICCNAAGTGITIMCVVFAATARPAPCPRFAIIC